jgi:hypothetical protein
MGVSYQMQRVTDVIRSIEQQRYQLPCIQPLYRRPFVWKQKQVLDLLDSIICGYPIGEVTVWKPPEKIPCRPFTEAYTSGERVLSGPPAPAERKAYIVLDGQQRLQSLFLSFIGRYNGKRVYLCIDSKADQTKDGQHYRFKFLTDEKAAAEPAYVHIDYLAKLEARNISSFIGQRLPDVSAKVQRNASEVILTFREAFHLQERILIQEIDAKLSYNQILEVCAVISCSQSQKIKLSDIEARTLHCDARVRIA